MPIEVSNRRDAIALKNTDSPVTVILPPQLPAAPNQSTVWTPFSPAVEQEIIQGWQTMARILRSTRELVPIVDAPAARVRFEDHTSAVLDGTVGKVDREGIALNRQYVSTVWDASHRLLPNASRADVRKLVEALTFDSYAHELQHVGDAKGVEQILGRPNVRFGIFVESEQSARLTELLAVKETWENATPQQRSALAGLTATGLPAAIEVSERLATLAQVKEPGGLTAAADILAQRPNVLPLGNTPEQYASSVKTELTRIEAIQGAVRNRLGEAEKTIAELDTEENKLTSAPSPLVMLANRQKRNTAVSDIERLTVLDTYTSEVRGDTQPLLSPNAFPALRAFFDRRVRDATSLYRQLWPVP